jgi:integrase
MASGRTILLPEAAISVIRELPQLSERWVFTFNGLRPITAFDHCKIKIDKVSGIKGWTLHDCRRTAATRLAEMGGGRRFPPHVIEAVLGHAPIKAVAGIYNRHPYSEECHQALEAWSAHIFAVSPSGNVTRMRTVAE